MTFSELNVPLRTDDSFRKRIQLMHHNKDGRQSIIEDKLNDIVGDVRLDYMHLVCIGVFKKLLTLWLPGVFNHHRLTKEAILAISAYRIYIRTGSRAFRPIHFRPTHFRTGPEWPKKRS